MEKAASDALTLRAAALARAIAVDRTGEDQGTRGGDRAAKIQSLDSQIAGLAAQVPEIDAGIARLEYEIERHGIRAPASGKVGEGICVSTEFAGNRGRADKRLQECGSVWHASGQSCSEGLRAEVTNNMTHSIPVVRDKNVFVAAGSKKIKPDDRFCRRFAPVMVESETLPKLSQGERK